MKYFKKFPLITYYFDNEDAAIYSRDIFRKLRVLQNLRMRDEIFEPYVLSTHERADVVAHKVYGNSHLHWVIYLANDVLDPKEWLMDDRTLDKYVASRYDNHLGTHHYERNGELADLRAAQIGFEKNPFGTVDSDPNAESFNIVDPNAYFPVSNFAYEDAVNDTKRVINIIKPVYINAFLEDVERKLGEL